MGPGSAAQHSRAAPCPGREGSIRVDEAMAGPVFGKIAVDMPRDAGDAVDQENAADHDHNRDGEQRRIAGRAFFVILRGRGAQRARARARKRHHIGEARSGRGHGSLSTCTRAPIYHASCAIEPAYRYRAMSRWARGRGGRIGCGGAHRLQWLPGFGIGALAAFAAYPRFGCGCSSGVEHNLAKVGVVGSNPIARSKFRCYNNSLIMRPSALDSMRFPW
jgi:hypothetical protein